MAGLVVAYPWTSEKMAFSIYASSCGHFDAFALGAILAYFEDDIRSHPSRSNRIAFFAFASLIFYFVTYVLVNVSNGASGIDVFRNVFSGILFGEGREVFVYAAIDVAAAACVIGAISGWRVFKIVDHRALVAVGRASYGGYLFHALIIFVSAEAIGTVPEQMSLPGRLSLFLFVWCCSVALAQASYATWERSLIRLGHSISSSLMSKKS